MRIQINIKFGSDFQKTFITGAIISILKSLQETIGGYHRDNKFSYEIDDENETPNDALRKMLSSEN